MTLSRMRRLPMPRRQAMMGARLMGVKGRWQRADGVCNLIAGYLEDRTDMLGALKTKSRNFH